MRANDLPTAAGMADLKIEGLTTGYGAFSVLRDVKLHIKPGLTVILGPNGAGKTTLLKSLAGLLPRVGQVQFDGSDLPPEQPAENVKRGLALVAEGRQLFPQMTVAENLELGGWLLAPAERAKRLAQAFEDFPKLRERRQQLAGTMSGGEQQMVAVARAMMRAPRLLMLDEPSMGLAPLLVNQVFDLIASIKAQHIPILLVEQNARKALEIADYAYVLERGNIVKHGIAAELREDADVIESYLG